MRYELVQDRARWHEVVTRLLDEPRVAVDLETTGLSPFSGDRIVGVSVGTPDMAWYCPIAHEFAHPDSTGGRNVDDGIEIMRPLLESRHVRKVFHNALFDVRFILAGHGIMTENYDCTLVQAWCEDERRLSMTGGGHGSLSLDSLGQSLVGVGKGVAQGDLRLWCLTNGPELLGMEGGSAIAGWRRRGGAWKMAIRFAPLDMVARYACVDASLPLAVEDALSPGSIYRDIERPLLPIVARMSSVPKPIDVDRCREMAKRALEWESAAREVAERDFGVNPLSTVQLVPFLFSRNGAFLPVPRYILDKRAKKASKTPSTAAVDLMRIQHLHPLPWLVLQVRAARKMRATYFDSYERLAADGCLYPEFLQWGTATGRFSSRNPNLQNVPRGSLVRDSFVCPPGKVMAFIDYGQVEPRLAAHFCREQALIDAFVRGEDVYSQMAVQGMFPEWRGRDPGEFRRRAPRLRQVAKTAVLAVFYGAFPPKLRDILMVQAGVNLSIGEVSKLVRRIRMSFPGIVGFVETLRRRVSRTKTLRNPFGRVRHFGRGAARVPAAFNTLVQGTAADLMKLALLRVDEFVRGRGMEIALTIHDELVLFVDEDELDALPELRRVLEEGWPFRVPMKAELSVSGSTWGRKVEVKDDDVRGALARSKAG